MKNCHPEWTNEYITSKGEEDRNGRWQLVLISCPASLEAPHFSSPSGLFFFCLCKTIICLKVKVEEDQNTSGI